MTQPTTPADLETLADSLSACADELHPVSYTHLTLPTILLV